MVQATVTTIGLQWRRITFISGILIGLLLWSSCNTLSVKSRCSSERKTDKGEWRKIKSVNYLKYIKYLSDSIDLTFTPQLLFSQDSFIHVFENLYLYTNDAKKIVSDTSATIKEKHIVIYSMQKMGLSNYLEWNNFLYGLYKNDKINFRELEISISGGGLVEYHILERSYEDKRVKEFFTLLTNDSTIQNEEKQHYKKIISGEIWNGLDSYLSDNYPCIYLVGDSLAKAKE